MKKEKQEEKKELISCADKKCPFHGEIKVRGREYKGTVLKKFPKRVVIEFQKTIYIRKFERYANRKTRLHAWLPACLSEEIKVGDYIKVGECRPLSKIIHFVVIKKLNSDLQFQDRQKSENVKISEVKKISGEEK